MKRQLKKTLAIILALMMLVTTVPLTAGAVTYYSTEYSYTITNDEVTIVSWHFSEETEIDIPAEINGYPVTAIGDNAFSSRKVSKVTIPDSVKTIGNKAFYFCENLENAPGLLYNKNTITGKGAAL